MIPQERLRPRLALASAAKARVDRPQKPEIPAQILQGHTGPRHVMNPPTTIRSFFGGWPLDSFGVSPTLLNIFLSIFDALLSRVQRQKQPDRPLAALIK